MPRYDAKKIKERILPRERASQQYQMLKGLYKGEDVDPMDMIDHKMYQRGGIQQSKTKVEFTEWGKKIALQRGIPSYNREVGIPMGQRWLTTGKSPGTDIVINFDDINFFNNSAMQQCLDDIRRTVIVNLDVAHRTIQLRLGKEISPETMNLFMETLQHRLAGGAVIQEHMSEVHPGLTSDAYGKVFTGDDELAEQFDRRFLININDEFHPERAEAMKAGVGDKLCLAIHEPTLRVRNMDGAAIVRSAAQSTTMAMVGTYRLTGESVLSDIAFSTRHAQQVRMGEPMWANRARGPNEIGGMPFGYLADTTAAETLTEPRTFMEILGGAGELDEFAWAGVHRITAVAGAGQIASFMTGDALLGQVAANYCIGILGKECWLRTGWSGQEVQHHIGPAYSGSLRIEEGGLVEMKGENVPYMSYTAVGGSLGVGTSFGAMLGRGSSWASSPMVKVTFTDPDLAFDFRDPVSEFAKAAIREFEPAGERDIIRPAK
ncbi:MAG: hypothetical protein SVM80_05865 [Halobacteriota archaeon]|nr:hypothetical protein [Halobacteriota archaeon]